MEYCPDEEKTDILLETLKEKNNNVVFSNIFTIGRPKKRKQKPTKVDKVIFTFNITELQVGSVLQNSYLITTFFVNG